MKNKAKNVPKRLTGLTQLPRLLVSHFWADGDVWGCTAPVLSESVVLIEGLKPTEKMQVMVRQDSLGASEVQRFLDGLDHARVHYQVSCAEAWTLHEIYSGKL